MTNHSSPLAASAAGCNRLDQSSIATPGRKEVRVKQAFEVKEFSTETWSDFEALFGKHKGVGGGCWCTFHRCMSTQFDRMTRDERKEFQRELAQQGVGMGSLCMTLGHPLRGVSLVQQVAFRDMTVAGPMGSWDRNRTKCRSGASHVCLLTNTDVGRAWRNSRCIQQWRASARREVGLLKHFPLMYQQPRTRNIPDRLRCISAKVFEKSPV